MAVTPYTDTMSIPAIVEGLRKTFKSGRTRSLDWRRQQLEAVVRLMDEKADVFIDALRADFGKPPFEALAMDVAQGKVEARTALKNLKKWTRPERIGRLPLIGKGRIVRDPLGVVLIISPWNYPVGLLMSPAVGAIAAGNAMVLKPSEITPHTSAALAEWLPKYLDPEAIVVVEGGAEETGALLRERFDHIMYTGNGRVGRIVAEAAAKHLTPTTLELGGKSPCIVNEDADLATTARRIAWGKFVNSGQTCIAPDYVLVHRSKEDALIEEIGKVVKEFYGDDPAKSEFYGRVVNERHHARLDALLHDGQAVIGGQSDASQNYIAPTVLRGVSPDSAAMREEIFGPILPVLPVDSMAEAISFVNERDKPLALYLFTQDAQVEEKVLAETSSGGACVNGTIVHITDPRLPFGGVGESGNGAYHGKFSFDTFSHRKSVVTRGVKWDPKMLYPPYTRLKSAIVKRMM